jgi:hypothetical protein
MMHTGRSTLRSGVLARNRQTIASEQKRVQPSAGSPGWNALGRVAAVVGEYRNHNEADVSSGGTRAAECGWSSGPGSRLPTRLPPILGNRSTPAVFGFVASRACKAPRRSCGRMARDRCGRRRHRGEDRGIGVRPLAASWPPDRRTADSNGAADTFPTFGPGLLASPRCPRKDTAFSGYVSLSLFSLPLGLIAAYTVHDGDRPAVG